jgi:hypothetical protein
MSRPAKGAQMDPAQASLEDEDAISGVEEGDEIMEEVEEQEGYSAWPLHP